MRSTQLCAKIFSGIVPPVEWLCAICEFHFKKWNN